MTDEHDDPEALAADYVLGTLEGEDRRRAEARIARDPGFARLVDEWSHRLAPLAETVPLVAPPPRVWSRIEAALAGPEETAPLAAQADAALARLRRRLNTWRWAAVAASAVAAVLAFYIAVAAPPGGALREGRYVAVLDRPGTSPAWIVTVDAAAGRMTIRPLADVGVGGKSLELWLIAGPGTAPRSLGLLNPDREVSVPVKRVDPAVLHQAAFAVSLEPEGGSPTGQPTGPVLYHGPVLAVGN